jgi:hypothetical protein
VRRGRGFTALDGPDAPPVVVINETMARLVFPGEDPVGRRIRTGPSPIASWLTIVGVVGDIRHTGLEDAPAPELYMTYSQGPPVAPFMVLRTSGDPAQLADAVRAEMRGLDPGLSLFDVRTMTDVRAESVAERRFLLLLVAVFGVLAVTLAAIGIYGVMALGVTERVPELGLRIALGAEPRAALLMVVGQALTLAATGVAFGMVAAFLLSPLLSSQLFGVTAHDPVSLVTAPIVLLLTAALAALVPATRAMLVDPAEALKAQ